MVHVPHQRNLLSTLDRNAVQWQHVQARIHTNHIAVKCIIFNVHAYCFQHSTFYIHTYDISGYDYVPSANCKGNFELTSYVMLSYV